MKIVYDHQIFDWQQFGGVSRYFYEIARNVDGIQGCEVEIFAPLYSNKYFRSNDKIRPTGFQFPRFRSSRRLLCMVNSIASKVFLKPRRDVDIFHETYYSEVDNCPHFAKRVITVYDMIHEKFSERSSRQDRTSQIKAFAIHRADHVICISQNTRRDLIEILSVPEEKISVVYLGCSLDVDEVSPKPPAEKKPFLLYVGHRGGYKNFDCLLRAYAHSAFLKREFSLVCFGGGELTALEMLLIKALDISPNSVVQMSGADDVLANLYASATAFVYPSLYEGFGIPPLEAMLFDCPVVCSNSSSLPEVVGDAAELFDPANETDLRMAIERVISCAEHGEHLVKRGRERVKQFSWEKCAKETLDVYEKLLRS